MSHGDDALRRAPERAGDGGSRCDVLFAGQIFFDLVLAGFERMPGPGAEEWAGARAISPGGAATRAVAAARLGLSTVLAGAVGSDFFGEFLCRLLSAEDNLQLRIRRDHDSDTPITVAVSQADERTFLSHGGSLIPDRIFASSEPRARVVQIGAWPQVPTWARAMRAEGSILFGEAAVRPEKDHSAQVLSALADLDVFTASAAEAMAFTQTDDPESAARALAQHVPLVTVTCGRNGALAIDARTGATAHVRGIDVDAVDPTGAGDVFTAAFSYALLTDLPLPEKLTLANLAAGLSVQSLGGAVSAPRWRDLEVWARGRESYAWLSSAGITDVRRRASNTCEGTLRP